MKQSGFFLLEVMIVLALIIVIVTLAVPQFSFIKKQIVHHELQKIIAECFYLRNCALVTNKEHYLQCNRIDNSYSSVHKKQHFCGGVQFGFIPTLYGPPSSPSTMITKPITFVKEKIIFYPDGTISSGTIYITDASQSHCFALTIATGQAPFIRMYEYKDRWTLVS